ncbi:hypothetical protein [Siminovitchia terrae]|uniref:hypothetical protein n=1 Tax=Siminovitchia terrae TaxID=1914933 RepID=UPI0028A93B80|nr:hypothetical protein [Siminovitchia terrae]
MNKFTSKEVRRSVRSFEGAIRDVVNSSSQTYKSRIRRIVALTSDDPVIKNILDPIFNIDINLDDIHLSSNGYNIGEVEIPTDSNHQIRYILEIFNKDVNGELSIENLSFQIYSHRQMNVNLSKYLREIAEPCLRELIYKLDELIEDEVDGKEEVSAESLQIINYGSISASEGSNIAMGKNIEQTTSYENISKQIMEAIRKENVVAEDKLPDVQKIAEELQEEINKPKPSHSKLKDLARQGLEIGEKGLLKVFSTVVTDPRWGQAVSDLLLSIY